MLPWKHHRKHRYVVSRRGVAAHSILRHVQEILSVVPSSQRPPCELVPCLGRGHEGAAARLLERREPGDRGLPRRDGPVYARQFRQVDLGDAPRLGSVEEFHAADDHPDGDLPDGGRIQDGFLPGLRRQVVRALLPVDPAESEQRPASRPVRRVDKIIVIEFQNKRILKWIQYICTSSCSQ